MPKNYTTTDTGPAAEAASQAPVDHPAAIRDAAGALAAAIAAGIAAGYAVEWPHSIAGIAGIAVSATGRVGGPAEAAPSST